MTSRVSHIVTPVVRPVPSSGERCASDVRDASNVAWRRRRGMDLRCQRWAIYRVDGRPLCALHAGEAALKILLEPENER